MGEDGAAYPRRRSPSQPLELYHLERDPAESRDAAAEHPEVVERLEAALLGARTSSTVFPIPALDG